MAGQVVKKTYEYQYELDAIEHCLEARDRGEYPIMVPADGMFLVHTEEVE